MPAGLDRIRSSASKASPSLARVGQWIAAHPIQALSRSAEEIAELTGTSVAAINRFSRVAGFDGFGHLKAVLGEELQSAVDPVRKLRAGSTAQSPSSVGSDVLRSLGSSPEVQRAAGRLLKAHQVWLLGLGASSYMAGYAAHVWMPYVPRVASVAGEGGTEEVARRMAHCGPNDLLVAISLPRYSRSCLCRSCSPSSGHPLQGWPEHRVRKPPVADVGRGAGSYSSRAKTGALFGRSVQGWPST